MVKLGYSVVVSISIWVFNAKFKTKSYLKINDLNRRNICFFLVNKLKALPNFLFSNVFI